MVKEKRKQDDNFIFDISNCPLFVNVLSEQAEKLFISRHTRFIDTVVDSVRYAEMKKFFPKALYEFENILRRL